MDAFLEATIENESFRAAGAFSVLFVALFFAGAFILNRKFKWWVSADFLEVEKTRAEQARADAAEARTTARADADSAKADAKAAADEQIASMREQMRDAVNRAHADADAKIVTMRSAMERREREQREDGAALAARVRADSQAELDRLLKVVDAIQREVESWRQAFHLADQANHEEAEARWNRIEAALNVMQTFVTAVQRQLHIPPPPELERRGDGRGTADVVR